MSPGDIAHPTPRPLLPPSNLKRVLGCQRCAADDAGGAFGVGLGTALGALGDLRAHASVGLTIPQVHLEDFGREFFLGDPGALAQQFPQGLAAQGQPVQAALQAGELADRRVHLAVSGARFSLRFAEPTLLMPIP